MTSCDEKQQAICDGEFKLVHKSLDKLDIAIRGNGKPGLVTRIDRLEQARASRSKVTWFIAGLAGAYVVRVLISHFAGA